MTESDHLGLGLRPDPPRTRRRRQRRGRLGRVVLLLSAVAVLAVVAVAAVVGGRSLLDRLGAGPADYAGSGTGTVEVRVRPGDSLTEVGRTLRAADVVASVEAFTDAAAGEPAATRLQPGYYRLHSHMSAAAALSLLLSPAGRLSTRVTVPEGSTVAQVVQLFADRTKLSKASLRAAVAAPEGTPLPAWSGGRPEGFLFPSTYEVDPGTTADDVASRLVRQFLSNADDLDLTGGARALHHTPYEVLVVASIVEKEAGVASDYPKVARVVYNRLDRGMALQLDSTLNYVLAERKSHLTIGDLDNPSAYNTYRHTGLPPTPIDNPGATALRAALHPATGDWLYFVTVDKQGHSGFTGSYAEFLRLKAQAKRDGVIK